jgi:hypothetical protein
VSNARSVKNYTVTLVLVIFSGFLGGHRFYAGKVGTGLLFLFTGGFFLIGWLIDIFTVAFGNFTDKTGSFIRPEIREAGPSNMSETSNPPGETSEATPTSSDGKKKGVPTWVWIVAGVLVFGFILQSCGGDTSSPETQSEAPVSETTEEDTSSVAEPEAEPEPEPERVPSEDVAYNGSGDSILQLELPAGPDSVGIASITHSGGSNFSIWSLDENLEQSDLLVNEIGNYSGTVPFSLSSGERITAFEISADGPWTVTLRDILTVREATQGSTTTGDGADVLLYRGATTVASISHEGGSNFSVWSYGPDTDLLVNEIGSYSGEVRWPAGVALIKVGADGTWSIALQ